MVNGIFKTLTQIIFGFNGASGTAKGSVLKHVDDNVASLERLDGTAKILRASPLQDSVSLSGFTPSVNDVATRRDVMPADIEFGIDGSQSTDVARVVSGSRGAGRCGIVLKSGGTGNQAFTQGQLVYDPDGTSALSVAMVLPRDTKRLMVTRAAMSVTGALALDSNCLYANENYATGYTWIKKGDALGSGLGVVQCVRLTLSTAASVSSSVKLPQYAVINEVRAWITTAYSTGATISVACGSTVLMASSALIPQIVEQYSVCDLVKKSNTDAVITATIGGSPSAGVGEIYVYYTVAPQS